METFKEMSNLASKEIYQYVFKTLEIISMILRENFLVSGTVKCDLTSRCYCEAKYMHVSVFHSIHPPFRTVRSPSSRKVLKIA